MDEILFFLHLPRTAGTTLNAILRENFPPEAVLSVYAREDYQRCRMLDADVLERIRLIEGHLNPESFEPPRLYGRPLRMFTLLRDPLERLVSEYVFQKTWPSNHLYAYLNENGISFQEYLASDAPLLKFRGKNFVSHCLAGVFAQDRDMDEVLTLAKKHLRESFCLVGIQERFDESLLLLAGEIGLSKLYYERRNMLRPGAAAEITDEDRALAADMNSADMELYAFARDLFEQRVRAAGPAFAARLREFRFLNKKYQKMCAMLDKSLLGEATGPILKPKA
ncbi:sulfotransferase family 2 domain-containing protein [Desulfovibrio sp. SGI.169]|uniref:sulfotransferase family 2 domain-containing protein n=1 Tax=Desulfovibrio sp. SGI.169 TaxID=3420561 RepID=UPI003D057BBE